MVEPPDRAGPGRDGDRRLDGIGRGAGVWAHASRHVERLASLPVPTGAGRAVVEATAQGAAPRKTRRYCMDKCT